jgi:hypothetical protein
MPDPEENHLGLSIQKVLVHIGRITPSSDRSPQQWEAPVKKAYAKRAVTG